MSKLLFNWKISMLSYYSTPKLVPSQPVSIWIKFKQSFVTSLHTYLMLWCGQHGAAHSVLIYLVMYLMTTSWLDKLLHSNSATRQNTTDHETFSADIRAIFQRIKKNFNLHLTFGFWDWFHSLWILSATRRISEGFETFFDIPYY